MKLQRDQIDWEDDKEGKIKKLLIKKNYNSYTLDTELNKSELNQILNQRKLTCDKILCNYIYQIAKRYSGKHDKFIIRFVLAYREWLNKYAWNKMAEFQLFSNQDESKEYNNVTLEDIFEREQLLKKQ